MNDKAYGKPNASAKSMGKLGNAIAWTGLGRLLRAFAQIAYIIVLGRFVGPDAFGIAVAALLISQLPASISTQPISDAIVQRGEWDVATLGTAFWCSAALGVALAGSIVLLAPVIADAFHMPPLRNMIYALAIIPIVSIPMVIPLARHTANFEFRRITLVESTASLVASAAAVLSLLGGLGITSILIYLIAQRILEAIGFCAPARWWPTLRFSKPIAIALTRYTGPLLGWHTIVFLTNTLDQFFVGRMLGTEALGYYGFARRLTQQPSRLISSAITRAAFPALVGMLKHSSDNNNAYQRLAEAIALLGTTVFLAAAIASDPGIALVMGERWTPATSLVVVFCFAAALMPSAAIFPTVLRAAGRTSWMMAGALARLALTAALLIYATYASWNTQTLALAFVALGIGLMVPSALLANHYGQMSNLGFFLAFLRGSLPATVPATAILLLDHIDFFDALSRSAIIELLAKLLLFITLWLVIAWFSSRRLLRLIRINRPS